MRVAPPPFAPQEQSLSADSVMTKSGVVIVGASIAGLSTAESLRSFGYLGPITLIGKEHRLPYNRPPLSKQVLMRKWEVEQAQITTEAALQDANVRLMLGEEATGLNMKRSTLIVGNQELKYDQLVVATGVSAARTANPGGLEGVYELRTIEDAQAIEARLSSESKVVVAGAGVLGCEVAAALSERGFKVILVGRGVGPKIIQPGDQISLNIARLFEERDVELRMRNEISELVGADGQLTAVRLGDGTQVEADLLISAIGSKPNVAWLKNVGADFASGVACDEQGSFGPGLYAVGDVAKWRNPVSGVYQRVEHQASAIEQGISVARLIATGETSDPIIPFFWSEIFGHKILAAGHIDPNSEPVLVAGEFGMNGFVQTYASDGFEAAVVAWNMPREFRDARRRVALGINLDSEKEGKK